MSEKTEGPGQEGPKNQRPGRKKKSSEELELEQKMKKARELEEKKGINSEVACILSGLFGYPFHEVATENLQQACNVLFSKQLYVDDPHRRTCLAACLCREISDRSRESDDLDHPDRLAIKLCITIILGDA